MAHIPSHIKSVAESAPVTALITVAALAGALKLDSPETLKLCIDNQVNGEIASRVVMDEDRIEGEALVIVPEIYPPLEDGRVLTCRDFWLQVHMRDCRKNPVMGLKFMDMGNGTYEMSDAFLTFIFDKALYFRPTLGHEAIEGAEGLIHNQLRMTLKQTPPALRHS